MVRSVWFKIIVIVSSIFTIIYTVYYFKKAKHIPQSTPNEGCVICHNESGGVGKSHPFSVFGCYSCHDGNPYTLDKNKAHIGIIKNPARLEYAKEKCSKCHNDIIKRINNSIMATNKGIIGVLSEKLENKQLYLSIEEIKNNDNTTITKDLSVNYFRKMCAACHINQKQNIFKNKTKIRGGGCIDCHGVKGKNHTQFTTTIPSSKCIKCHNRSNRIGLSYYGKFQSAGYGTPYIHGEFSHKILNENRFYLQLHADIHYTKYKLDCIDCHTEWGLMGDGHAYKRYENQVIIQCIDCHNPIFGIPNKDAQLLASENGRVKIKKGWLIAYTHKNFYPIYNLQKNPKNNDIIFFRKRDGKPYKITFNRTAPYHSLTIHKRLSCQACHSEWLPSCFGCHVANFTNVKQFDWLLHKPTKGAFREFSSFNRFMPFALGIDEKKQVAPFAPGCQTFLTQYNQGVKPSKRIKKLVFASWDPHTTQLKAHSCENCHLNPQTLGLGGGYLHFTQKGIKFVPIYNSKKSGLNIPFSIDSFVDINGNRLQDVSIKGQRPFNKEELMRILKAGSCIECHNSYYDKIYINFKNSLIKFNKRETPCSK
ncbi:hypothetical protein [Hippea jasoniae]|uniref:hypothetical protein n=1 Tax=Hippea jasoniae TaxID=944479 RepID=UPI000559474F|nr:hypothetical protein [Hippea jasoniae]